VSHRSLLHGHLERLRRVDWLRLHLELLCEDWLREGRLLMNDEDLLWLLWRSV